MNSSLRTITTLTEFLTSKHGIIYSEPEGGIIIEQGKPRTIKDEAVRTVVERRKIDYIQAERLIEQRLLELIQAKKIMVQVG